MKGRTGLLLTVILAQMAAIALLMAYCWHLHAKVSHYEQYILLVPQGKPLLPGLPV